MSKIRRHREKHVTGNELSRDHFEEGTAARTRPLSLEEIMLSRERKKLAVDAENGAGELRKLGKSNVESLVDHSESDRGYKQSKNIDVVVRKHNSEDRQASRKKEDASDNVVRSKRKEKREIEADMKVKSDKDPTSRAKSDNNEIRSHRRNKNADRSKDDFEDKSERKLPKVGVVKEKNVDRDRGKSERETKRKHGNIDDEKSISDIKRSDGKKRDSGKWHNSESLERRSWKDSSQSHYDKARLKRRRSRSWELGGDRDQRSPSVSPRAGKRSSYHGQDRGEGSSHSFKDRSARHDYEVDRYRTSSNGGYSSSHYRRQGGYSSGIGGYSPRKRKTEAAVKTPSPTSRSPDRKNVGWDRVPAGMDIISSASLLTNFQPSPQAILSNSQKLPSTSPVTLIMAKPLSGAAQNSLSMVNNMPVDSFELTQATRPMRRLYLENLPDSSSDMDVMECLNDYLLSRGVNHYQGVKPCISCVVNKEKRQAVVEFLTPEDATLAVSFDGRSFSGSILKIRRPNDFVEPAGIYVGCVIIHLQDGVQAEDF